MALAQTRTVAVCAWCEGALDAVGERLPGRVRCPRCGAATTDPWPTDAQLEQAYAGWYRPAAGRFAGLGDVLLRRTRGLLAARLDEIAPPGPVLDVGSGDGALLDALAGRGRRATGLERSSTRSDVRSADVTEINGEWAAVVFWHSLEHLRAPRAALRHAAGLLARGGVIVVAMPNAGSLQARAFGSRWLALDPPRHLVHLPAATLVRALGELGLSVERISHVRGGQVLFGWLHGLVRLLPGKPDLYDAIRRPEARRRPLSRGGRLLTLSAGALLLPPAVLCAAAEVSFRRGGSVYVEARRG